MGSNAIHFGTSGWRAVIGEDFTFANVRLAAAAIADHARSLKKRPTLLVGHDTRFFSEDFAQAAAEVLQARGCRVLFCDSAAPTPAIAFEILRAKLDGAINITASHNPAAYNGVKFSGPDGGPALPEITHDIEARAAALAKKEFFGPTEEHVKEFERVDVSKNYLARLAELVRFDIIEKSKLRYVCDALHGCGAGYLDRTLHEHGIKAKIIGAERDVLFDGGGPDPSEENLAELSKMVVEEKAAAGLATDGDADRFGIVDRDGAFISPNHILGLAFDYLIETRGWKLGAARSVATTQLLDAVAKFHGVPLYESPVGFKFIGARIEKDEIALGGEESAGMTIRGHVPEKDGILACLLVAEMIAARKASLCEQLSELFRRVGQEFWPIRVNLSLDAETAARVPERLREDVKQFAGRRVTHAERTDGLKLILDGGAWVLLRPSGTEPVVRVYAEASSSEISRKLAEEARKWIAR
ncbi:MAG: phosphoglucomutase/phosphomannomutase family protein [Candidatus Acidiferrales bacterium]